MSKRTELLNLASQGDREAAEELCQDKEVQRELRRLAERFIMNNRGDKNNVRVTELADEAFLRTVRGKKDVPWESRHQFRRFAAKNMRRILIDMWRQRHKHYASLESGGQEIVDNLPGADTAPLEKVATLESLQQLGECLTKLEDDERQIIELRHFLESSWDEIAETLEMSKTMVHGKGKKALEKLRGCLLSMDGP